MKHMNESEFPTVAPSLIAADWGRMFKEVESCMGLGICWLHCDIMDGHFVPNMTMGPDFVAALKKEFPDAFYDCHLMVEQPDVWTKRFIDVGADMVTVHAECDPDAIRKAHAICQKHQVRFGVSIKPKTPVSILEPWFTTVDSILVMSVEPGFYGQSFIEGSDTRIAEIKAHCSESVWLSVDGGINPENASLVVDAGAQILVAGGSFFKAKNRANAYSAFQQVFDRKD